MLVISRKTSESIFIGSDIEIIVSEISGDTCKLAIRAPASVSIMRKELLEAQKLNREASEAPRGETLDALKKLLGE